MALCETSLSRSGRTMLPGKSKSVDLRYQVEKGSVTEVKTSYGKRPWGQPVSMMMKF